MTQKDRASFLLKAFGHHALAGIGDILTQLKGGLQTDTGEIIKGADAIDYLRKKVANASGTAETFSHKLLDTLAGQEKLLHGSIETLEIMAGKAFADLFRPIVEGVLNGLNAVLDVVQATPKPIKRLFAGLVLAAGAFLTLVGGFLAVQGLVAVLGIAFEALGVSFGALAYTLGLAMALLGVLGVAVAGLRVAWDKNLGGIADRVQRVGDVIRLVFQGISQLVEQGGFSGALREELGKAENAGIKRFLVQLWMVGYRLERFWTGLKDGFSGALEGVAPLFKELSDSFDALSSAVGDVFGAISGGAAELPSETFRSWGQNVGQDFAWLAASATALLSAVLSLFAGLVRGGRETFGWIRGAVSALGDALAGLGRAWDALTGKTQEGATEFHGAAGEFQDFGHMLGVVARRRRRERDVAAHGAHPRDPHRARRRQRGEGRVREGRRLRHGARPGDRVVLQRGASERHRVGGTRDSRGVREARRFRRLLVRLWPRRGQRRPRCGAGSRPGRAAPSCARYGRCIRAPRRRRGVSGRRRLRGELRPRGRCARVPRAVVGANHTVRAYHRQRPGQRRDDRARECQREPRPRRPQPQPRRLLLTPCPSPSPLRPSA